MTATSGARCQPVLFTIFFPPSHSHPGTLSLSTISCALPSHPLPLFLFLLPLCINPRYKQPSLFSTDHHTHTHTLYHHHHDRIKLILTLPPHTIAMASPPQQIASMLNATTCRPSPRTCSPPPPAFWTSSSPSFGPSRADSPCDVYRIHQQCHPGPLSSHVGTGPRPLGRVGPAPRRPARTTLYVSPPSRFTTQSFDYPSPPLSLPWCIHKTIPTDTFIKSPLPEPHAEDEARSPTSKSRRTNGGESTSAPAPPAANKSSWFHLVFRVTTTPHKHSPLFYYQHNTPLHTATFFIIFLTTTIDLFSLYYQFIKRISGTYRRGQQKGTLGTAGKTK